MTWGLKYKLETYDRYDVIWSVYFYKPNYEGVPVILKGGENPITFEFSGSSDELTDPLRVANVNMSINVTNNFMYEDIVSPDQLSTYVEIYQRTDEIDSDSVPYWIGFVDPGNYEEPYDVPPYNANVTCVDGLLILESIPYAETETANKITWYSGYKLASEILFDIFSKIGVSEFYEFINLYEYRMNNGVGDSPFDQFSINTDAFSLNEMDCRSVLEEILGCFNASILLKDGVFHLYRTADLIYPVQYGRHFTGPETKTPVTFETPQSIYREEFNNSSIRQIPNSSLTTVLPARKITITQDYAYKDSWLENWRLRGETYDSTENTFKGWTMSPTWWHITPPDNPDGICMFPWGTPVGQQPDRDWARQEFGEWALPETAVVVFSYNYSFRNHTGAVRDIRMFVEIKTANGSHYAYLDDEENKILKWSTTQRYIDFMEVDVPEGESGGGTFEARAMNLPAPGPYVITIYGPQYASHLPNFYMIFKDVVFRVTSDKLAVITRSKKDRRKVYSFGERIHPTRKWGKTPSYKDYKTLIDTRDIDEIVDKDYTVFTGVDGVDGTGGRILGDVTDTEIVNVLEQFAGALAISVSDRKQSSKNFKITHGAAYYPVLVEDEGDVLKFTGGNFNFSGSTTITNTAGNLSGTVQTIQNYSAGQNKIMRLFPSDEEGSIRITITGEVGNIGTMTYNTSRTQTCDDFVSMYASIWGGVGFSLKRDIISGNPCIEIEAYYNFGISWSLLSGSLSAGTATPQVYSAGTPRIDTITLTGDTGSANITVNGITRGINIAETFTYSEKWKRREWADDKAKPLIQLITEEIARQYSRPKYMLDLRVLEDARDASGKRINQESTLNILGCFTDELKVDGSHFPIRDRSAWELTGCEMSSRIDLIRLSGVNGACMFGTERGTKEVTWPYGYTLLQVAENAISLYGTDWRNVNGIEVRALESAGEVYFVFTAVEEGFEFTPVIERQGGSLDGEAFTLQENVNKSALNYICYFSTETDSHIYIGNLNLVGIANRYISIRYMVVVGNPTSGQIYYSNSVHARHQAYRKDIVLINDGKWHTMILDMGDLDSGGTDWVDNIITGIWFDLTDQAGVGINIEWIGFARAYAMNRGTFNVRTRQWQLDLIEIIK